MYRPALVRSALGVGMLTIVMLALAACGGAGSAQEEEQASKVRHIPEDSQTYEGEPLPAGRYVTEEYKPAMSFTLGKGWTRGAPSCATSGTSGTSRTTPFGFCLAPPRRSTIRRGRTG